MTKLTMHETDERISLSFVVPVYSGAAYLRRLVSEIEAAVSDMQARGLAVSLSEVVLVDDSAIDKSPEVADALAAAHAFVRVLHLSRNFGQHPATMAGIGATTGEWIVTLDEDLQHKPVSVEQLLRHAILTEADLVYATAEGLVHESAFRDWSSRLYKRLIQWTSGNNHIRIFNSFRLIRGEIGRAAARSCGHDTYLDIALSWYTQRVSGFRMPLKDERYIQTGASGYRLSKLLSHARRMMMSSGPKALRLGGLFGIAMSVVAFLSGLVLVALQSFYPGYITVRGWASTIVTLMFLSGATTLLLGVVLEYLSLLVMRAHGKPLHFAIDRSRDRVLRASFEDPSSGEKVV